MMRVYWWQGRPECRNFGDWLTPWLCSRLSRQSIEHAPPHQADLIAIGSVLERLFWPAQSWLQFTGAVWGAGRLQGSPPFELPAARVLALRGHLTARHVASPSRATSLLGDPGLLCGRFVRGMTKRYKLGVVPHWSQREHPLVHHFVAKSPEIALIDICRPVPEVITTVGQCEFLIASALHGLVLADSLETPNRWLWLDTGDEDYMGLPPFKYRDYYSVFGLEAEPLRLLPEDTLETVLSRFGSYSRPGLTSLQDGLLAAFPFS